MDNCEASSFKAENNSSFEPLLIKKVCEPVLRRIPLSVNPNTISLVNHLICWVTASCAYVSIRLDPVGRLLALVGAGIAMFCLAVGDCLDGMQARRTNRCTRLGELLDHWLDAIHVPMVTFGISMALELNPWQAAAVHVTNAMIYNAQLVLYNRTGRFVHPSTSGTDAQVGVAAGYLAMGLFFLLFRRSAPWVEIPVTIAVVIAIISQLRLNLFYYLRLRRLTIHHLPFVLLCAGFAALHLLGVLDRTVFLLAVVLVSFRITGSYVLFTIIARPFSGFDAGVALLIASIFAANYLLPPIPIAGTSVQFFLPHATLLYMVCRNLVDLARHYPELIPGQQAKRGAAAL